MSKKRRINSEPTNIISYPVEATPSKQMQEELMQASGERCKEIFVYIYRAVLGEKTFHVCWAGGKFIDEGRDVGLTLIGRANCEALMMYPGSYPKMALAELKLSDLELRLQITYILNRLPNLSRVCFFGDVSGELDGKLFKAFNVCDEEGKSYAVFDEKRLDLLRQNSSLC
jgi:hypothetical protein